MTINKQALRGQSVDANFYLAECCNCGQVMPSSKLIESRNYMDGDADCYCPHCNADDCDISDMGSAASEAWNYQQKRIDALLDELEAANRRNAELNSTLERWATDRAQSASELDDAEKRIAALESDIKSANERYENRVPTEWAYNQACAAIEKHRLRADNAEAQLAELVAAGIITKVGE